MADIRNYLNLSVTAASISSSYSVAEEFKELYNNIDEKEKNSFVLHFFVNNIPYAFKDKPILYEQIKQYLSDILHVSPIEVKLIGSAKTGFSISPLPDYGKAFGQHSDLDFSIVNEELFRLLEYEFHVWAELFKIKQIKANNSTEEGYWLKNLENVPKNLKSGFIDTHFIPNRVQFITTKKLNNSLWLIQKYMNDNHGIFVKKVSARIYKNWYSFTKRLNLNTERVLKNEKTF